MRVKLYLKIEKGSEIHLQYAYALQGVIYKVIQQADPEFSEWLHMKGYNSTDRPFKLFTYSALSGFPYVINQQKQTIRFDTEVLQWEVSFCVDEQMKKFITGLFLNQNIEIGTINGRLIAHISRVELLEMPHFSPTMFYKATSPICISEKEVESGKVSYLSPTHPNYERLFISNLANKYRSYNGLSKDADIPDFGIAKPHFRLLSEIKMRKFDLYKKSLTRPIEVKGYEFLFELHAPPEWQRIGYNAGFGVKNSTGFGFCRV